MPGELGGPPRKLAADNITNHAAWHDKFVPHLTGFGGQEALGISSFRRVGSRLQSALNVPISISS
jgi:hypothetical protein